MPKKVRPGQSFNFPAPFFNRLVELTSAPTDARPDDINGDKRLLTAQVRNDTGDNLPAYSIVVLEEVIPTVPANATSAKVARFITQPVLSATKPAGTLEEMTRVAILQEAIPDSAVGEAVLFGRHPVKVLQGDADHAFIRTIADTTTHFASCYRPGIPMMAVAAVDAVNSPAEATWGLAKVGEFDWGPGVAIAIASGAISTSTDGQVASGTAQLLGWSGSSPATLSSTGLPEVEVWNPHEAEIPDATHVLLGQTDYGWIVIAALNYCPGASGGGGGGGEPI